MVKEVKLVLHGKLFLKIKFVFLMRKASELLLSLEVLTDHSPGCMALAGTEDWQPSNSPRGTAGKGLEEVSPSPSECHVSFS